MASSPYNFIRNLSQELDPEKLQRRLLASLLDLQNVERGSIWVKQGDTYRCIEALGSQSEKIKGISISAKHPSIVGWVIEQGKMTVAEPGKDQRHYKEIEDEIEVKSKLILSFPLFLKSGEVYGAIQLIDTSAGGNRLNLNEGYLELLQQLIDIGSIALSNSLIYTNQLQENRKLRQTLDAIQREDAPIGQSAAYRKAMKIAGDYAKADFPVLITGESGTGKELFAREIHRLSLRQAKPFLAQNCSAIPDTLLESELFGYEKGAFTGATRDKMGLFEAAHGGTVFLDEIGDMPANLQARILRFLQDGEVKPLGSTKTRKVDVRIISATNRDLRDAIVSQQFREDLFYRLNVLPLHLPPLRERREDIPLLLDHFLRKEMARTQLPARKFSGDATKYLMELPWKGNIRELENLVKHILVVAEGSIINREEVAAHFLFLQGHEPHVDPVPDTPLGTGRERASTDGHAQPSFEGFTWDELERAYVEYLLDKNRWNITRASQEAGVNRSTFDSRLRKLGIRK
jgi:transcriptional regulator with GAF, ATPase, and Fis domain